MALTPHYKAKTSSTKVLMGGPTSKEQLDAIDDNVNWIVLGADALALVGNDSIFCNRANALKCALQTFGPTSPQLPDFRTNVLTENSVFHGHVRNKNGTTYVLEWTVVDPNRRIMAIIGFGPHENYNFKTAPFTQAEKNSILNSPNNQSLIIDSQLKSEEARAKIARTNYNYRHLG